MRKLVMTCLLVMAMAWGATAFAAAPGANSHQDFDYGKVGLRAGLWLDRNADEVYQGGNRMEVGFQVNEDAYAVVYRIDTEGQVTILWPRARLDDGFVFSGHQYQLPIPGAKPLVVGRSEGEGYVEIIASSYPFDLRELAIDFHGENRNDPFNYEVAGDPFLAMNEVNFAITGLEDTADYVVSDYTTYYVHRKVDHPRYLCSQCHVGDDNKYDPYDDHCTLDIEYDYGWSNRWYDTYGYYPVYAQPVYVYVDPWNNRPWVNFWYWPGYRCGPTLGYSWYSDCWAWCDSPYYYGDVYSYYRGGGRRYRPLTPGGGDRVARKTREYSRVTPLVKGEGPNAKQRLAMTSRRRADGVQIRERTVVAGGRGVSPVSRGSFKGQGPVIRSGPVVTNPTDRGSRPGLRIRKPGSSAAQRPARSRQDYRHVAGNGADKPALKPVRRAPTPGTPSGVRSPRSPNRADKPARTVRPTGRTIKPVEPKRRGTRIWNSGSTSNRSRQRDERVAPHREGRKETPRRTTPRVTPKREQHKERSRSTSDNHRVKESSRSKESVGRKSTGGSSSRNSGKSSSRSSSSGRRR